MNELQTQKPEIDFDCLRAHVEAFEIRDESSYLLASNELITLKRNRNAVVAFFAEMKSSAHAAWKAIVSREKFFTDQIDAFESMLKRKMLAFTQEQERVRREREAELQREADAKAAAERARLERNAKANAKRGNEMNAEMYRSAAANCVAPVIAIASSIPKAAGVSKRKVWKAQLVDRRAFVTAAAANENLLQFISVDVTTMAKQGWRECAGVKFYEDEILNVRG